MMKADQNHWMLDWKKHMLYPENITIILLHHLDYCCSSLQHWRFRNKSPRRCIVHFWGLPNGQPGVSNSSSDPPHEEGCAIYRLMIMGKASFLPGKGEPGCRPRPTS